MSEDKGLPGGPVARTVCSQNTEGLRIPAWGIRSHLLQLRVHVPQLKFCNVATETGPAKEINNLKKESGKP